jgi:hypothetical protein
MKEPLAQYYEVRPSGRRYFDLFADRVIVKARSANADSEITIRMSDLRPEPNLVRVRPKEFGLGLGLMLISLGCGIISVPFGFAERLDRATFLWPASAGAFLLVSLVIMFKTFKKIEFTQFVSHHGRPLLDVARSGPQRGDYDAFVETLISQIRAHQPEFRSDDP